MAVPLVSVIVPAYNASSTIARTLEAVGAQDIDGDYEVIVVDNGSDDGTPEVARASASKVTVITKEHSGPGEARNLGARRAAAPALAFTDADCAPATDWLRRGVAALEGAELVQGSVRADPRTPPGPFDRTLWVSRENGLYETANLFIKRDLFWRLGGFEDWLVGRAGRPWGEDAWLGCRARRSGAATSFAADAVVDHAVFRRGALSQAAERIRLVDFPAMTRKMPELRDLYCFRRRFLSERSAAFDAALVAVFAAARTRSPIPLMATLPYARIAGRRAVRWGRRVPLVLAGDLLCDAAALVALVTGSVRWRNVVL